MIDVYATAGLIHNLSNFYNPTALCWETANLNNWRVVHENWREYYSAEKRHSIAEMALAELKTKYKKSKVNPESFNGYKKELEKFRLAFIEEVKNYRYNSFNKHTFINYKRLSRVSESLEDRPFANYLCDTVYITDDKITKNDMIAIIETFCYCFSYIADNLNKRAINLEQLNKLELPVEVEKLRELVELSNIGELFDWNKTEQGFIYWAKLYLDKDFLFKERVYEYLNELHPEFKVIKEKKYNAYLGSYDAVYTKTVTTAAPVRGIIEDFNNIPF